MSELCSFFVVKALFTECCNCTCAKKIVILIRFRHTCVALILKNVLSLETSSEINFEFIKLVKKMQNVSLGQKQIENIKYFLKLENIKYLSQFSITFFLLPNQVDLSAHCLYHFSTSNVLRLKCNITLIFL